MSALDWANWLRSGAIVGPPVQRFSRGFLSIGVKAPSVRLNRFVMVHICDTTKSADIG